MMQDLKIQFQINSTLKYVVSVCTAYLRIYLIIQSELQEQGWSVNLIVFLSIKYVFVLSIKPYMVLSVVFVMQLTVFGF